MKPLLAILTILTMALATAEASQVLKKKSPHHPDILAQCEDAPNCKTYDTEHGLMFRFKPGMEPGTADYAARFPSTTKHRTLIKRDTCGTQWWGRQTNFISVNKFYNGNLRGFIQSSVAMDVNEGNWCATLAGALGDIAGAVNPIADGFFGLVNALCA